MDRLNEILKKQAELMVRYHEIEKDNGQLQTEAVHMDLDDRFCQARLKDFAWRFTEEIAEAINEGTRLNERNFEFIDALHFLSEMAVMLGWNDHNIVHHTGLPGEDNLDKILYLAKITYGLPLKKDDDKFMDFVIVQLITHMGMCMNQLKNKPWSQSHRETNEMLFMHHFHQVWIAYFAIFIGLEISADEIYSYYMDKNSINKKRQADGY